MTACARIGYRILALFLLLGVACVADCQTSKPMQDGSWQRVTAHLNGVFSPRGFFNILVRLYSLPTLESAQFNLRQSSIILDFPPGTPPITINQIQQIEKDAGYRPGQVEIQQIPARSFAENGPGWTKIKHPKSKYAVVRWLKQNF
jgi:hypothetical protein